MGSRFEGLYKAIGGGIGCCGAFGEPILGSTNSKGSECFIYPGNSQLVWVKVKLRDFFYYLFIVGVISAWLLVGCASAPKSSLSQDCVKSQVTVSGQKIEMFLCYYGNRP